MIEMKVSYHPSGRYTLMKRFSGQRMFEDGKGPLFSNVNEGEFYNALCTKVKEALASGTKVVLGSLGTAS